MILTLEGHPDKKALIFTAQSVRFECCLRGTRWIACQFLVSFSFSPFIEKKKRIPCPKALLLVSSSLLLLFPHLRRSRGEEEGPCVSAGVIYARSDMRLGSRGKSDHFRAGFTSKVCVRACRIREPANKSTPPVKVVDTDTYGMRIKDRPSEFEHRN